MSEIPEDILAAVEDFSVNYVMPDPADVRHAVAELILAERERCARIADEQKFHWREAFEGKEINLDYANGRSHGAECVAGKIRGEA